MSKEEIHAYGQGAEIFLALQMGILFRTKDDYEEYEEMTNKYLTFLKRKANCRYKKKLFHDDIRLSQFGLPCIFLIGLYPVHIEPFTFQEFVDGFNELSELLRNKWNREEREMGYSRKRTDVKMVNSFLMGFSRAALEVENDGTGTAREVLERIKADGKIGEHLEKLKKVLDELQSGQLPIEEAKEKLEIEIPQVDVGSAVT